MSELSQPSPEPHNTLSMAEQRIDFAFTYDRQADPDPEASGYDVLRSGLGQLGIVAGNGLTWEHTAGLSTASTDLQFRINRSSIYALTNPLHGRSAGCLIQRIL